MKISLHYLLIYYFNIDNIYQLSYSSSRDSYVCRTGWRNISIRPSPSSSEIIIFCFRSEPPNFQPFGLGLVSWTFLGLFKIVRSPASGKKTSGFQTVRTFKICRTSGPDVMSGRALGRALHLFMEINLSRNIYRASRQNEFYWCFSDNINPLASTQKWWFMTYHHSGGKHPGEKSNKIYCQNIN